MTARPQPAKASARTEPADLKALGSAQIAILRTVCHGDCWFVCCADGKPSRRHHTCLSLHSRGLLRRDPVSSHRWTATEAGTVAIIAHDEKIALRLAASEAAR